MLSADRDFDCCVIGSGAGGAPVALALAEAGYSVLVLEKGPWLTEKDFAKDEIACCRRSAYTPNLQDERHVLERRRESGDWYAQSTFDSGWDFWNGNMVGGATNLMSGYFLRQKPKDFRLRSEYGPVDRGNVVDWPIGYDDLEPYYTLVERRVGVSGRVVPHPFQEPRSTPDFPYPPTAEHPVSAMIDTACKELGYRALPLPRAILSMPADGRRACVYSNYCGSYGCETGAKGSARAALLTKAAATGRCEIRAHSMACRLIGDEKGRVEAVEYIGADDRRRRVDARIIVVACQPIESARLLLMSPGPEHPKGLGNNRGQVGRNLLFSAGGAGSGVLRYAGRAQDEVARLQQRGTFVNRTLQDWYEYRDPEDRRPRKGGSIDFLFRHANAISRAISQKRDDGRLLWGKPLKDRIHAHFTEARYLSFEVFNDWTPVDDCFVTLDPGERDRWGLPVGRVRLGYHPRDLETGRFLARKGARVLEALGCEDVGWSVSGSPPQNLVAGGCRFGADPETSVLDPECRLHDADNVFVSDGSFMPTGGSVAYTWTIYANAFRVADAIIAQLGGGKAGAKAG
ncbi:MAG: GMC family oxidoreductase [Thiohalocapsa sp.]|nr:GMC family oxidoreductase [Thiohalocapsa sp.]